MKFKIPFFTDYFNRLEQQAADKRLLETQVTELVSAIDSRLDDRASEIYDKVSSKISPTQYEEIVTHAIATDDVALFNKMAGGKVPNISLSEDASTDCYASVTVTRSALRHAIETGKKNIAVSLSASEKLNLVEAAAVSTNIYAVINGPAPGIAEVTNTEYPSLSKKAAAAGMPEVKKNILRRGLQCGGVNNPNFHL